MMLPSGVHHMFMLAITTFMLNGDYMHKVRLLERAQNHEKCCKYE